MQRRARSRDGRGPASYSERGPELDSGCRVSATLLRAPATRRGSADDGGVAAGCRWGHRWGWRAGHVVCARCRSTAVDGPVRRCSPLAAGADRCSEPVGAIGLLVADQRKRQSVGAVPDRDVGDLGSLAAGQQSALEGGEVRVVLGQTAAHLDDRVTQGCIPRDRYRRGACCRRSRTATGPVRWHGSRVPRSGNECGHPVQRRSRRPGWHRPRAGWSTPRLGWRRGARR